MLKDRLFGYAQDQYNEMIASCPWFDETKHMFVTIEDMSSNIMELVGIGTNFTNTKPALRAAFKRLRRNYNEEDFTVMVFMKRAAFGPLC